MALIVDTGVLYALADEDDDWHERARSLLEERPDVLLVPLTVVPEVAYLIHHRLGPLSEQAFIRSIAAGELSMQSLTARDFERATSILGRYPDIGFVDASVVAIAERLRLRTIATTDRRHFGEIRPSHIRAFDLVP
jgi:predicted nucleic acid-binding protein